MNKRIFRGLLLLTALIGMGVRVLAQSYTISGTITDQRTGETLIGATVLDQKSGKGTITNVYGFFTITLPSDSVNLRISFTGYATQHHAFMLDKNTTLNVALYGNTQLQEVVIRAERPTDNRSSQMSAIRVPVEQIKSVPVLFGESDVLKALQLLPGVQSGSEGTSGMYVRGGGPDENLFLLDGVSLYNVNHLGGFFSAFNSDAIKNVTLYKGSFPAHFGGRLSSVLDITTINGNDKEYHGTASVGLIAAKVSVEGPIVKEKTTFAASFRRTYFDALIQPIVMTLGLAEGLKTNGGYYFYDFNGKITHKFSEKSRLYASFYSGDDKVYFKIRTRNGILWGNDNFQEHLKLNYSWGNLVGSVRWNYIINPKLFMNTTVSYTRYRNLLDVGLEEQYSSEANTSSTNVDMSYHSGIHDLNVKSDFDYDPNPDHHVRFGGGYTFHIFSPEVAGMKMSEITYDEYDTLNNQNQQIDTTLGESKVFAHELNMYIEDDWAVSEAIKINAGVQLAGFGVEGKFYPSIQPRLSGRMMITDLLSVKAGYAYMTQYMHLLSNSNISLPTDLWVPVTAQIKPMNAHQVAMGLFYDLKGLVDLSVEGYYKHMNNLVEYKDGASFWGSSANWESKVAMGDGWSYGVELLAQKTLGKFTGWVGYTWSKTERKFDRPGETINDGKPFPAKYDRRHDISVVGSYKITDNIDISATWVFSTGNCATLALQTFQPAEADDGYWWYNTLDDIENRNNYRLPNYHRMDFSVNFHKELRRGVRTINVSVYNLYNRHNPYTIYRNEGYVSTINGHTYGSSLMQLSIFPIIPSVSYIFKF